MNRHGKCMLDLIQLFIVINTLSPVVKQDCQLLIVITDIGNHAHISVKYTDTFIQHIASAGTRLGNTVNLPLLLVIILDLHDLVTLSKGHIATHMLGLVLRLRIQTVLQLLVHILHADFVFPHRTQDLDFLR